jgi:circadian clock protein KaiC
MSTRGPRDRKPAKSHEAATPAGHRDRPIVKKLTGIRGFDDISHGGLPDCRITTILGGPGAGKTVFAMQTIVNRFATTGESSVVVTFEEPVAAIKRNMASFDWPIDGLTHPGLTFIDAQIPRDALIAGAFDLNALLAGLTALRGECKAMTVVFDGLDMLLGGLRDEALEQQELIRLNDWVRDSEVSAIITVKSFGNSDRDQLRSNFIQYITDCVIVLNSKFSDTTSSRSLRITKFRGSGFAANPVPFVIARAGIDVLALKSTRSDYPTFTDRVSSGIPRLDLLLGGGYTRGSSILISGSPGTSKTSLSANFAAAACARGEKALFVSFDETGAQIVANMKSIGLDLARHVKSRQLIMASLLSNGRSPEEHFVSIRDLMEQHHPSCLVVDPLSALLMTEYPFTEVISESLIDTAKASGITVLCTSLLGQVSGEVELSASHVSTIADTWIHVSYVAEAGERNRALTIIKSRGTGHSNQVRELLLSAEGVRLEDVYIAEGRVLMGSARAQKEADAIRLQALQGLEQEHLRRQLEHEIAELEDRSIAVARDLAWKKRQALFHNSSERLRVEAEASAALTRLEMRTADDDTKPIAAPEEITS